MIQKIDEINTCFIFYNNFILDVILRKVKNREDWLILSHFTKREKIKYSTLANINETYRHSGYF